MSIEMEGAAHDQTGLPMAALSVAGAQWRLKQGERVRLNTQLLPWALRAGTRSTDLMCLYYEEHFQVRRCGSPPCRLGLGLRGVGFGPPFLIPGAKEGSCTSALLPPDQEH